MTHPIHPARAKKIGLSSLLEELAAKLLTPGQLLGVPLQAFGHNDSSELYGIEILLQNGLYLKMFNVIL